jgi:hypothetical protein
VTGTEARSLVAQANAGAAAARLAGQEVDCGAVCLERGAVRPAPVDGRC